MKSSPALFLLIKSLTMSEKRHFKLFAARHVIGEQNNYIKLFDLIQKADEYNEDEIIATLKKRKERFVAQFPKYKNYLYELILKSLRVFHSGKSSSLEINELLEFAELLYGKALYEPCGKVLEKARKIAYASEKHELLSEILRREELVISHQFDASEMQERSLALAKEKTAVYERIRNLNEYRSLYYQLLLPLRKRGWVRTPEEQKEFDPLYKNQILSDEKLAIAIEAKLLFNLIHIMFHICVYGNTEKAYRYARRYRELVKEHPEANSPGKYIIAMDALFYICIRNNKHPEAWDALQEVKNIKPADLHTEVLRFDRLYYMYISYYLNRAEFGKALSFGKDMEEGFKKYEGKIGNYTRLANYYNLAYCAFAMENHKLSLYYLNRILNDPGFGIREDTICFAKLLSLIIHFELKNYELLQYTIKSTYRFLYKRNRLFKTETIILAFLRKKIKLDDPSATDKAFRDLLEELLPFRKDPYEKRFFNYIDFICWLTAKIEKKKFSDIFRRDKELTAETEA